MDITWELTGAVPQEEIDANIREVKALGLPYPAKTTETRLAVVAGGPSVKRHIKQILKYPDRWICASAFPWAASVGITGTYFNIDPSPTCVAETPHVQKAILSSNVSPKVFEALKGKDVSVFDLHHGSRQNHGCTTATAVPELSILLGYKDVCFFGCESSFGEVTHAYRNDAIHEEMGRVLVECGGRVYQTRPDYLLQALFISEHIRNFPFMFKEKSGGMLWAFVKYGQYRVTHISESLNPRLKNAREPRTLYGDDLPAA